MYKKKKLLIQIAGISLPLTPEYNGVLTFAGNSGLIQSITFIEEENNIKAFVINNSRARELF